MAKETLYDVLGVKPEATAQEIKSAWRVLTRKHHSDTGDGNREALEKIQKAYKILSDEDKRKKYNAIAKILVEKPKKDDDLWSTRFGNSGVFSGGSVYSNYTNSSYTINFNSGSVPLGTAWNSSSAGQPVTVRFTPGAWTNPVKQKVVFTLPAQSVRGLQIGDTVDMTGSNGIIGNAGMGVNVTGVRNSSMGTWVIRRITIRHKTQDAELELESI